MPKTPDYSETIEKTEALFTNAADLWTQTMQTMLSVGASSSSSLPSVDPSALVDPVFDSAQRVFSSNPLAEVLLDINREYVKSVMGAVLSFQGIVRERSEAVTEAVRDQVGVAADAAKEQVGKIKKAAEDQVAETERAVRRTGRQTAKNTRQSAS